MTIKTEPKTYVIGDIRGKYKALKMLVDEAGIDGSVDTVITLGNYIGGNASDVLDVVEVLLQFDNLIPLMNYKDKWLKDLLTTGETRTSETTVSKISELYGFMKPYDPTNHAAHMKFWESLKTYHYSKDRDFFTSGGIPPFASTVADLKNCSDTAILYDKTMMDKIKNASNTGLGSAAIKLPIRNIYKGGVLTTSETLPKPSTFVLKIANAYLLDIGSDASVENSKLALLCIEDGEILTSNGRYFITSYIEAASIATPPHTSSQSGNSGCRVRRAYNNQCSVLVKAPKKKVQKYIAE